MWDFPDLWLLYRTRIGVTGGSHGQVMARQPTRQPARQPAADRRKAPKSAESPQNPPPARSLKTLKSHQREGFALAEGQQCFVPMGQMVTTPVPFFLCSLFRCLLVFNRLCGKVSNLTKLICICGKGDKDKMVFGADSAIPSLAVVLTITVRTSPQTLTGHSPVII